MQALAAGVFCGWRGGVFAKWKHFNDDFHSKSQQVRKPFRFSVEFCIRNNRLTSITWMHLLVFGESITSERIEMWLTKTRLSHFLTFYEGKILFCLMFALFRVFGKNKELCILERISFCVWAVCALCRNLFTYLRISISYNTRARVCVFHSLPLLW